MDKLTSIKRARFGQGSSKVAWSRPLIEGLPGRFSSEVVWGLLLFFAVVLVFSPVWWAGFIWDDNLLITSNPVVIGPLGLKEIWTTSAADICPLTLTTFWAAHALWGLAPLPYHLVNVVMHGMCAVLLWRLLRLLEVTGAWLGAALWAFHPVQVESVAWISEMKNTESGIFYLLTILFFVKGLKTDGREVGWSYGLSLLFALMAMASKSSTAILPAVLALCAWWVEGRWRWRNLAKVAPIVLISIIASMVSVQRQLQGGAGDLHWTLSWPERIVTAGDAVWFYFGKLIWPYPLMMIYPRWQIDAAVGLSYLPLLAVGLAMLLLWMQRHAWGRPFFFVFAYFITALLPALGVVNLSYFQHSLVADHFQYLASMGPLALAGAGMARLAEFANTGRRSRWEIINVGVLGMLGLLSWQRAWVFENEETLWIKTVAQNPSSWSAHQCLGLVFMGKGQVDAAIGEFQKSLETCPWYAEGHYNLGVALVQKGQVDEGMVQFHKALEFNPSYVDAYINLGSALTQKGQPEEGLAEFQQALKINPNAAEAYYNIGLTLFRRGHVTEAMAQFQRALSINPHYALAYNNLGNALMQTGKFDEAMVQYQKALDSDPALVESHIGLGSGLMREGQVDEAMVEYQKALEIDPKNALAHNDLGNILLQAGRARDAVVEYQRSLVIDPDRAGVEFNLAKALSQTGQLDEAILGYQRALELNPQFTEAHNGLGIAFAEKGKLNDAIAQFQAALKVNPNYANAQKNLAKLQAMEMRSHDFK